MRICVTLLKGGKAATTSCAHLLGWMATDGTTALGVDTDPQGTLLEWAAIAGDDFPLVVTPPTGRLHRDVQRLDRGYDHIVIDTPNHPDEDRAVVTSAMRAADVVVFPLAPTPMEFDRLNTTLDLLADARDHHPQLVGALLLTRVRSSTRSSTDAVTVLTDIADDHGIDLLDAQIPLREHIAQSFGDPTPASEYELVWRELQTRYGGQP